MNKVEYLNALERELRSRNIGDIEEIISEYSQHFDMKSADGYSEEETAARLGKPRVIASQFVSLEGSNNAARPVLIAGAVISDIFAVIFFALLFAWVAILAAASLAFAFTGVLLIFKLNIQGLLPPMPYAGNLFIGISLPALSLSVAAGAIYCFYYFKHLLKIYFRWHKNLFAGGANIYPPQPKHPQLPLKLKRRLRSITLISMTVFFISFIIGYAVMAIIAGSFEFWHVWNWFQ